MNDDIDILKLMCVGGRLNPEPSRALPFRAYRDPAKLVHFESEKTCKACLYGRSGRAGQFCSKGGEYGKRCEFFRMAKW